MGRAACKPDPVGGDHSSGTRVAADLELPTRTSERRGQRLRAYSGLLRGQVCHRVACRQAPGGLLPHRFTFACAPRGHRRYASLLHFLCALARWALPTALPCGVRTFLGGHGSLRPPGRPPQLGGVYWSRTSGAGSLRRPGFRDRLATTSRYTPCTYGGARGIRTPAAQFWLRRIRFPSVPLEPSGPAPRSLAADKGVEPSAQDRYAGPAFKAGWPPLAAACRFLEESLGLEPRRPATNEPYTTSNRAPRPAGRSPNAGGPRGPPALLFDNRLFGCQRTALLLGTGGGSRTPTGQSPAGFESAASTVFRHSGPNSTNSTSGL